MDTMGKNYMDKVDHRLVMQDKVLESIGESVKEIQSKSRVWDTFQHHVTSWSSVMTAVDAKADHLSRAQAEQQAVINGQVSCLQNMYQMMDIEQLFLNLYMFMHVCS